MKIRMIRITIALAAICAVTGASVSALAQMGSPDAPPVLRQKWKDDLGGVTCSGECPGSLCCSS